MAVSTLMPPFVSEVAAVVGEFAKLFEELLLVLPSLQQHGNVDVACGKPEAVAMGTQKCCNRGF